MREQHVAALLLAAGSSTRFGGQKLTVPLGGMPLVRWAAIAATHSLADEVVVVVSGAESPVCEALAELPVRFVIATDAGSGMSASLRAGIEALDAHVDAALVLLGDQPLVTVDVVNAVIARFGTGNALVVQPSYRGESGHPVLFARALFEELCAVTGDRGGRDVATCDPSRVALVPVDVRSPGDVDTQADYSALRATAEE